MVASEEANGNGNGSGPSVQTHGIGQSLDAYLALKLDKAQDKFFERPHPLPGECRGGDCGAPRRDRGEPLPAIQKLKGRSVVKSGLDDAVVELLEFSGYCRTGRSG